MPHRAAEPSLSTPPLPLGSEEGAGLPDGFSLLASLNAAILLLDRDCVIHYANMATENLLQYSASQLTGMNLSSLVGEDAQLLTLVHKATAEGVPVSDHEMSLDTPRTGRLSVTVQISPVHDRDEFIVLSISEMTRAAKIWQQMEHRSSARSVTAMAAILAHEVKNPLSGIRGAAQLIESSLTDEDKALAKLIQDEADRIVSIVDRMEMFSAGRPSKIMPVNIHVVLDHVRRLSESGFARNVRFVEQYDPSLPPVPGDKDLLIQAFLNLAKNAAEAVPEQGGEIVFSTSYRHGVRVASPDTGELVHVPLMVSIQDNGSGIPEDIRPYLFDPFITSKVKGSGLGLALTGKIIHDHGGTIEFESAAGRTVFRIMLPIMSLEDAARLQAPDGDQNENENAPNGQRTG